MAKKTTNILSEGMWGVFYLINKENNIIVVLRNIGNLDDLDHDVLLSKKIKKFKHLIIQQRNG